MHELIAQPKMLLVVIVYLLALVGTGAYFAKKAAVKKEGKEDFFLAGRGLGKIVAVGTILATYTGGGTVTGGGNSLAFNYGLWSGLFFTICPVISMSVLCYLTLATATRYHSFLKRNMVLKLEQYQRLS